MTRLHFFRNLRTAIMLLIAATVIAAGAALWWVNATGLPETWRAMIEHELEKEGVNVSVASLSYQPLHGGVVATEVRIFSDASRTRQISRLERVVIDFDKSRLARGKLKLIKFELKDGRLDLPVDPDDPNSEILEAEHVNATIGMRAGRLLEIRDASGQIEGIEVALSARILGYRPVLGTTAEDPNRKARMEVLRRFLTESRNWKFDEAERPKLTITIDGDLADRNTLHGRVRLAAKNVEKNGHTLDTLKAEAEWTGSLLTLTSLKAMDRRGELGGRIDFDMSGREGRFGLTSTLDIPRLLRSWFGIDAVKDVSFAGEQKIETRGSFQLKDKAPPEVKLTGVAACKELMVKGVPFDSFQTSFSWSEGNLYLRDLKVVRADGQATGKLLIQDGTLRAALKTNMPLAVGRPFFVGQAFGHVLNDFTETDKTKVDVNVEFGWEIGNPGSWVVTGHAKLDHCAYRGTPFLVAETDLDLSHRALDFQNGAAVIDYHNYAMQRAHDGAKSAPLKVRRVIFDNDVDTVTITGLEGTMWPAPILRMFAKNVADNLENYRFHQPPVLQAAGVIDTTPQGRTDLKISFRTNARADYEFLEKTLPIESPSGTVRVQNEKVTVDDLEFEIFEGKVAGKVTRLPGKQPTLAGEFSWNELSFNDVASLYGFDPKGGGVLTGRLDFTSGLNDVSNLSGRGLISLEEAKLFSVPIFGPLSPVIAGILSDKRAGFQQARNAFCTFIIRDGVFITNDFRTGTASIVFTGDARIDLEKRMLDMTMRMNAKGLLSVLTLPLRPFYGLFQFHGSGPLKDPEWKNVMFTSPPESEKEALESPPKPRIIRER